MHTIKSFIRKILMMFLGSASAHVFRQIYILKNKMRGGYFSYNSLDKQLEKYVDYDNGFYVELGANDGIRYSNSYYFDTKRNWKGILIEPIPHNFLICQKYRSKKNHTYCNACVSFDYKEKYVDMKYADQMTISENLELDLESKSDHIKKGESTLTASETIVSFGAVAATLDSLLVKSKAPQQIDFLSLDVEGAELEVLKGINFEKFSFKYMLIEIRDLKRVEFFLKKHGYILEKKLSWHDYLFKYSLM